MSKLRFDGKVAIVTGAGNGLGKQYALLFASRGAKVVVNDLGGSTHGEGSDSRAADKVVEEIKAAGGEAVANYDSVEFGEKIVQTAVDTWGRVDIVVNNAGILRDVAFAKMSQQDWDLIYTVHMLGAYKTTKAAWPYMVKQKYGRIINVASAAGLYGNYGQSNYSAMKLGLVGFTKTLAREGERKNIYCNVIAPLAGSRMTATIMPSDMVDALRPEFVSPVVAYLCHESTEANGGIYELGAGWVASMRWQRSQGGFLPYDDTSIEAVSKIWEKVEDFDNEPEFPENTQDSFPPVVGNLERYKEAASKL